MASGVYLLTCKKTGKCYVGSAVDIDRRLKHHRKTSFRPEAFYDDVLELCEPAALRDRENHWMFELETLNPKKGYNRAHSVRTTHVDTEAQLRAKYNKYMARRSS